VQRRDQEQRLQLSVTVPTDDSILEGAMMSREYRGGLPTTT
jgi:hypothetical protein